MRELLDGAGDGLPGVFLESFAARWLLSTTGNMIPPPMNESIGSL